MERRMREREKKKREKIIIAVSNSEGRDLGSRGCLELAFGDWGEYL